MRGAKYLITVAIFLGGYLYSQEIALLDLTDPIIRAREFEPIEERVTGGSSGGGRAQPSRQLSESLRITLLSLDRGEYRLNDDIRYEVRLQNVGTKPILIPWDPSPRDIEPPQPRPYAYDEASLGLTIGGATGNSEGLEAVLVYGSAETNTLRELAVGQWVRIRGKARLKLQRPTLLGQPSTLQVVETTVRAVWTVFRASVESDRREIVSQVGLPLTSENGLPLRIDISGPL